MERAWAILRQALLLLVAPMFISWLVPFIVLWLFELQFLVSDGTDTMARAASITIDLLFQSAYFSTLVLVTGHRRVLILLIAYQAFMVFMFLRFGSSLLYLSVVGSIRFLGLI